jgi:hypothetical protein
MQLTRAKLTELWPGPDHKLKAQSHNGGAPKVVRVQLNPQTLKVAFSNQNAGGDQPKGSPVQFVGKGTTKLSAELFFDVSQPVPIGCEPPNGDVRKLTKEIAYFMTPQRTEVKVKEGETHEGDLPPGVRLQWGTFLFEGVMNSMDETLDLFSSDGKPMRATVAIALSKQEIQFAFGAGTPSLGGGGAGPGRPPVTGARALHTPQAGESLQQILARTGVSDWQQRALRNGIENPRLLPPGVPLDLLG